MNVTQRETAPASDARAHFMELRDYLSSQIIGQQALVERLLVTLLADGHLLVEGPPGLAKTRAVKALAHALEGDFHRVQFTPDMLPADLTGSEIYRPEEGPSVSSAARCFTSSFSPMKSIARRRRFNRR